MEILKFLQIVQLKCSKQGGKAAGFTLIELLIGLILAFLIIAPLLGFVVNIMNTDRQEQAKSTSEQELQVAADYITRDLQQAVYIYDADGVAAIQNNNSSDPAFKTDSNQVPVLVFWKRKFISNAISIDGTSKCTTDCNDAFVYALVAYYLSLNDTTTTWSGAAQIRRVEIQDGVKKNDGVNYLAENDSTIGRDKGFYLNLSKLKGETLAKKMNTWTAGKPPDGSTELITKKTDVLVDYIDQTSNSDTPKPPQQDCPKDPTNTANPDPQWQRVPRYSTTNDSGATTTSIVDGKFQTYSFYACVNSSKNTVQVFLRGNALARISPKNNNIPKYNPNKSSFFPTARIEVAGSGGLGNFK